jgi:hypothetical protein
MIFAVLVAGLGHVAQAEHFEDGDDPQYIAPLVNGYAIERLPKDYGDGFVENSCALIRDRLSNLEPIDYDNTRILTQIEQIGVKGPFIAGKSGNAYFIFDTRQSLQGFQYFNSPNEWKIALAARTGNVQLTDPDAYAASLPDQSIHSWNHMTLHELFGLSDDDWCELIGVSALAAVFLVCVTGRPTRYRKSIVFALAFGSESICEHVSPSDPVGLAVIFNLIIFIVVALVGTGMRQVFLFLRKRIVGRAVPPMNPNSLG